MTLNDGNKQRTKDYIIPQSWKRAIFRRGGLPMGDVHDILARVKPCLDESDEKIFRKHLSGRSDFAPQYEGALESIRSDRTDEFFRILGDETEKQWDRMWIGDSRTFSIP